MKNTLVTKGIQIYCDFYKMMLSSDREYTHI